MADGPLAPRAPRRVEPELQPDDPPGGDPLRGVRLLARLLDDAVEIPGTGWRIGIDPLIGLVPAVGDVAAAVVATYVLIVARSLGAPASVLARIVLNVGLDALVGVVPFFGDVADFGVKANRRNLQLLERWLERPRETRRASGLAVAALLVLMLLVVAAVAWAAWALGAWALRALSGG